jgi:hypothetical protein
MSSSYSMTSVGNYYATHASFTFTNDNIALGDMDLTKADALKWCPQSQFSVNTVVQPVETFTYQVGVGGSFNFNLLSISGP